MRRLHARAVSFVIVAILCPLVSRTESVQVFAVDRPTSVAQATESQHVELPPLKKKLLLPGEVFHVAGRPAFVIAPEKKPHKAGTPWAWYAPTFPNLPGTEELWMFERFAKAGIAIAGIDVGESYGSPEGRRLFSALYRELTEKRGFSTKPVLLGRSRGGLMTLGWAVENADKVGGFAGIYPVCNIASYPGIARASSAFAMTPEELTAKLAEHNPLDRLAALAKAKVPLFAIHGDVDKVVPLEANSGEMRKRYESLGGEMQLVVPPGQGHNMWSGFFQSQELVDFVIARAQPTVDDSARAVTRPNEFKFTFNTTEAQPGFTLIAPQTAYDAQRGFGFLRTASPDNAAVFAMDVDEGNYDVTIRFGDQIDSTSTTIKAESRRLMIERVETTPGRFESRTFTVNVRKPPISTGGTTSLNDREKGPPATPDWDEHLTLEFNGKHPGVAVIEIKPARDAITVFLAGDSTVTDQRHEPYAGWGQMLPRFFGPGVAVSNQAESGLALFSFERQKRLEKVLSMMKKGDYLFIQFGHNDQKDKRADAGPFTTYKANLKQFVAAARSKEGIPVLVTPMERRRFDKDGRQTTTLADYAESVRQVGAEEKVPVIDLHAMSLKFYAALGPERSTQAFAHYPANTFPGQDKPLKDDTHHNNYGGYELARCIVEGIKAKVPALAAHLSADAGSFDPSSPDSPEKVSIPASPLAGTTEKPAGN